MYPPEEGGAGKLPEDLVAGLGPANPPFNVRHSKQVVDELGSDSLPHGFTAIPVMSYELGNINEVRAEKCCPPVREAYYARYFSTYSEYES